LPVYLRQFPAPRDYRACLAAMRRFTHTRTADTPDEIWQVSHPPVYTQGLAGKSEHLLNPGLISVVQTDRGGQITYHGPGQVVLYPLYDLARLNMGVRDWVWLLEQAVIDWLAGLDIHAERIANRPGVYVNGAKIAALGLKVRRGRCYHGLSFNRDMDLSPFSRINPCGYPDMATTDLKSLKVAETLPSEQRIGRQLAKLVAERSGQSLRVLPSKRSA